MMATQRVFKVVTALTTSMVAGLSMSMAFALGLGSLEVQSNLDQPLVGIIELRLAPGDEVASIDARIASREEFEDLGIDYPEYLGSVRLLVEDRAGVAVLRLLSDSIINEPFVHLLVRVDWSGGSFLREYTALIDPPIYASETPPAISQPRAVEDQVNAYTNDSLRGLEPLEDVDTEALSTEPDGSVDEVINQSTSELSEDYTKSSDYISFEDVQASGDTSEGYTAESLDEYAQDTDALYGPVVAGESLSLIASELQAQFPDLSIYQIMKVMFEENQSAFIKGNINGLLKGSILKIGDINAIRAVELSDAREFYRDQLQDWDPAYLIAGSDSSDDGVRVSQDDYAFSDEVSTDGYQSSGDTSAASASTSDAFRVGAASDAETFVSSSQSNSREGEVIALRDQITQLETSLVSSSQQNQELTERISILESQLTDLNRLMALGVEDADMANLEATLAAQNNLQDISDSTGSNTQRDSNANSVNELNGDLHDERNGQLDEELSVTNANSGFEVLDLDAQDLELNGNAELDNGEGGIEEIDSSGADVNKPSPIKIKGSQGFIGNAWDAVQDSGLGRIIAGVGALLLAGLALLVYRRRQADEEFEVSMLSIETATTIDHPGDEEPSGFDVSVSEEVGSKRDKETSFLTVYSDSDAVVQADEVDPIAEADVYIAYGRDEQAEEVLLDGVATSPTRIDIKHKLLALYHKNENIHGFERVAEELYAQRDIVSDADWSNVIAMGQEISPDNPLFDDATANATAALAPSAKAASPDYATPSEPVGKDSEEDSDRVNTDEGAGLVRFDDVKDEHSELDDVEFNALDVPPASNGGRVQAQELASAKDAIAADDEIDLLYDLDEELTLTADEVSYDIDDSVLFADDDTPDLDEEASVLEFEEQSNVDAGNADSMRSDTTQQMSDLDVASSYDEARTQFELAKVFVDLGDEDGAKKILKELAKSEDIDDDVLADAMALLDSIDA